MYFGNIIIAGLATYRLAQLVVIDHGPFDIFEKLRLKIRILAGNKRNAFTLSLAELFECVYCVGIWIALGLTLLINHDNFFLTWFAIAGLQAVLEGLTNGNNEPA